MKGFVCVLAIILVHVVASFAHSDIKDKRDLEAGDADWNSLGWAWGKRSAHNDFQAPHRMLRAWRPVKKNPDWNDLGWTWGRK